MDVLAVSATIPAPLPGEPSSARLVKTGVRELCRLLVAFAGVALTLWSSPASAQEWKLFESSKDLFLINFPGTPTVTETKYDTEYELALPARIYAVTEGRNKYSVTAVDYTNARQLHADRVKGCTGYPDTCTSRGGLELRGILEWAVSRYLEKPDAKVTFYRYGESDRVEGRYLHLVNVDKSTTFVAIYVHENRLYLLEATVAPGSPPPILFEQGFGFFDKDGARVRYRNIYRNGFPPPPREQTKGRLGGC